MKRRNPFPRSHASLLPLVLVLVACLGMVMTQAAVGAPSSPEPMGKVAFTFSAVPAVTPQSRPDRSDPLTAVGCVAGPTFALVSIILAVALIRQRKQSRQTIQALQAQLREAEGQADQSGPQ